MRCLYSACLAALGLLSHAPAEARVAIEINLSTQTMQVRSQGATYAWPVSTARAGYATPRGRYRPTVLKRMHYSRKYDLSPMPHSIFFNGGYAIHGTYETRSLGRAASHGCVRLAPRHAARLFEMVKAEGATITIVGARPGASPRAKPGKPAVEARSARRRPSGVAPPIVPARAIPGDTRRFVSPAPLADAWQ